MKKSVVITTIVLIVIILAAGAAFWRWESLKRAEVAKQQEELQKQETEKARKLGEDAKRKQMVEVEKKTSDWNLYRNVKYGYQLKYPGNVKITNIPSGMNERDDTGYNVSFSYQNWTFQVYSSRNDRSDKTLSELVEKRNDVGAQIFGGGHYYGELNIGDLQAFQYRYNFSQGDKEYLSINSVILGKDYYYQIMSNIEINRDYSEDVENTYDLFVKTFKLL